MLTPKSGIKTKELPPVREAKSDFDAVEMAIRRVFRKLIYLPILKEIGGKSGIIKNAKKSHLLDAIASGKITYYRGVFQGRLSAEISKELRALGAMYVKGSYLIAKKDLPQDMRSAISISELTFVRKLESIDKKLAQILPDDVADAVKVSKFFDSTLWKTDRQLHKNLDAITILPDLSPEQRRRIADEWQNNMKLWIKDFTEKEIKQLRSRVQKSILAGNRYDSLVGSIQASHGVSVRKAKFLARQETGLLMAKFKETRYKDAGVDQYKWRCVTGTALHPVRPAHKALDGKIFNFDDPPITTGPGEPQRRNNPGEDYNCRCLALPIVRFK